MTMPCTVYCAERCDDCLSRVHVLTDAERLVREYVQAGRALAAFAFRMRRSVSPRPGLYEQTIVGSVCAGGCDETSQKSQGKTSRGKDGGKQKRKGLSSQGKQGRR
jgi:hypothetical protein